MDIFIPDMYMQSIYTINYKKLKKNGIKCLIFDLNNTITSYACDYPKENLKELFHNLERDFKIVIVSNSSKDRVRPFKEKLNVDSSFRASKPLTKKFKKIMDIYDYKDTEFALIGDMLLTDIWGGNKMGFTTILVNPISEDEPFYVRVLRSVEKRVIKKINKKDDLLIKGEYYE